MDDLEPMAKMVKSIKKKKIPNPLMEEMKRVNLKMAKKNEKRNNSDKKNGKADKDNDKEEPIKFQEDLF